MTHRRSDPHALPLRHRKVARWLLCLQLLLMLWSALPPRSFADPAVAGLGGELSVLVCTAQGMKQVRLPTVPAQAGSDAAQAGDPSDAPDSRDEPDGAGAAGTCLLCHARFAMAVLPVTQAWRIDVAPAPRPSHSDGLPPAAVPPWQPLQARAPPAAA